MRDVDDLAAREKQITHHVKEERVCGVRIILDGHDREGSRSLSNLNVNSALPLPVCRPPPPSSFLLLRLSPTALPNALSLLHSAPHPTLK
jgi:hypothetical protein